MQIEFRVSGAIRIWLPGTNINKHTNEYAAHGIVVAVVVVAAVASQQTHNVAPHLPRILSPFHVEGVY